MNAQLLHGDCLERLKELPDNSVDAVVTDPPYGLSFMGKKWDYEVPSEDIWRECLRVLKPGGHLLAFAGTRTQHRMAVRIEDAGFEIRDMIAWVYGSGFPKSLDVSKAIDKVNGDTGRLHRFTAWMRTTGLTAAQINAATDTFMGSHYLTDKTQPAIPTAALWARLRPLCGDVPAWVDELVERIEAEREVVGQRAGVDTRIQRIACATAAQGIGVSTRRVFAITAPATDAARQWQGWGTALKPALEPVTVARKPFNGTVAANVLAWGTGAINVDGCRVGTDGESRKICNYASQGSQGCITHTGVAGHSGREYSERVETAGRWPANIIHDGSEEVVGLFPDGHARGNKAPTVAGGGMYGHAKFLEKNPSAGDSGSAARFFYCAKASKRDRDEGCEGLVEKLAMRYGEKAQGPLPQQTPSKPVAQRNHHPTVKPTDLMRYLCRLVTPPGGTVLDPFMGSGSTGKAAILEGFQFIGIEREAEYLEIAKARIEHATKSVDPQLDMPGMV